MRARLVVLAALLTLTGCGIPAESTPRAIPADSTSPNVPTASPSPSPVRGPQQQVKIFLVRDKQIAPVLRLVTRSPSPNALLDALLKGPDPKETNVGFRLIPFFTGASADQRRPSVRGPVTVQLPPLPKDGELPTNDSILGFACIVFTLTADEDVSGVNFVRDKQQIQVPKADSQLSTQGQPVTAGDYRSLLQGAPK